MCLRYPSHSLVTILVILIKQVMQKKKSLSRVWLFVTPWTIQSMEFCRPEYWSGQPIPSPGDLPDPGIKLGSPALQAGSLPTELWGNCNPNSNLSRSAHWHTAESPLMLFPVVPSCSLPRGNTDPILFYIVEFSFLMDPSLHSVVFFFFACSGISNKWDHSVCTAAGHVLFGLTSLYSA